MSASSVDLQRAVIEVFGGCNYSCVMCPQSTGRGSNWTKKMPLALFENILDQLPGNPVISLEGDGEPTMAKDLPKYVQACTDRGFKSIIKTNGKFLTGQFMRDVIDAGLCFVRFSCIGYTPELYKTWMSEDSFELVKRNAIATKQYIGESNSNCELSSYHLILDNNNTEYEVEQYIANWIDQVGCKASIWRTHNWSGNYNSDYERTSKVKKTCGRPFAPDLFVRAGGLNGLYGAVGPCCQTMGPPTEDISVLGHFQNQTFDEIWYGEEYNKLRKAHEMEDWPEYCNNCDLLYEDTEILVWSNDSTATAGILPGTQVDMLEIKSRINGNNS